MAVGIAAMGCSKGKTTAALRADTAPASASGAASSTPNAAPAPRADVGPLEALAPTGNSEADVRTMVARWNQAMATRDVRALSKIYAGSVDFYGTHRTLESILKTKKKAFEASPDYTQSVGPVTVEDTGERDTVARFEKRWTQNGRPRSVEAVLTLGVVENAWHVLGETDAPSVAREKARQRLLTGDCNTALESLVASAPEVKKLLAGPTNPGAGHEANVLIEDGEAEGSRGLPAMHFRVAESHPDRVVTVAFFEVDFADHTVRQVDIASPDVEGKTLKVDPKKLEAAQLSCPDKFWE